MEMEQGVIKYWFLPVPGSDAPLLLREPFSLGQLA